MQSHENRFFEVIKAHLHRIWDASPLPVYSLPISITFSLIAYVLLIRHLRYRRAAYHVRLLAESKGLDMQEMPLPVAQKIYDSLMHAEFPFWFWKGIELALFRTYGIPTISSQLTKTSRLVAPELLPRRYVETEVLFLEFALRQWGTVPWLQAMARTRAIHAGYRKSGAVREEDMLYTLAALATQPCLLVEKLEWRSLNEVELAAVGTLYRAIGDALGIDYTVYLAPFSNQKQSTSLAGLDFYYALRNWQVEYETRKLLYTPQNRILCDAAIGLLLLGVPGKPVKRFVTTALTTIMDDKLREAMGFPPTPYWIAKFTNAVLVTRKLVLRYLCPPRPDALKIQRWKDLDPSSIGCAFATEKASANGHAMNNNNNNTSRFGDDQLDEEHKGAKFPDSPRTLMTSYVAAPYFVKPTMWNRLLSPRAWWWWLLGLPIPGDDSIHEPNGYYIPALGPNLGRTVAAQEREEAEVRAVGLSKGWQYL